MANSTGPDQTAPKEQSDLGLQCLHGHLCSNNLDRYSKCSRCFFMILFQVYIKIQSYQKDQSAEQKNV